MIFHKEMACPSASKIYIYVCAYSIEQRAQLDIKQSWWFEDHHSDTRNSSKYAFCEHSPSDSVEWSKREESPMLNAPSCRSRQCTLVYYLLVSPVIVKCAAHGSSVNLLSEPSAVDSWKLDYLYSMHASALHFWDWGSPIGGNGIQIGAADAFLIASWTAIPAAAYVLSFSVDID